ncbi:calcineurin-like phosphoesterase protein [Rutstroemia sp. NJR-2017a WRK4]|nr:calcineurin-like phosphoesterase protein [Rutstroemia sp. NJR-2017a WRK4]
MAPPYYPHSSRDRFVEPPSVFNRVLLALPKDLAVSLRRMADQRNTNSVSARIPRWLRQAVVRECSWRRLFSLPHLLVAVWIVALMYGERWVFEKSVQECAWDNWERWPSGSTPHHLIFLADPQLTDPHSYPDRPWPLSTLTVWHTDNYMMRSYIQLSKQLHPDTVFFLGDLFDGGREWKTAHGNTEDPAWAKGRRPQMEQKHLESWGRRYGEDFWLKEYGRFSRIFSDYWNVGGSEAGIGQRGRKLIASLPGNHDLGFGAQIKVPVRDRFEVYFGDVNRVDVIANHTFVSVDSVSLSAGSSGRPLSETEPITKPVNEFLENVQVSKRKAVARELDYQAGKERAMHYPHTVEDLNSANYAHLPTLDPGSGSADFPTILLTHVPLYRNPGTPCGPLREHWPPTPPPKGQTMPVNPDERNALSISRGYQYQNVLSNDDSIKLIQKIGNVVSVFSGDDHDYCEVVHPEDKNHAREITVKSMSWVMGIRRPGFLMLSLWNPIRSDGQPLHYQHSGHGGADNSQQGLVTMQSHLCLLPDQISILINYGIFAGLSVLILLVRAICAPLYNLTPFAPPITSTHPDPESSSPLLPTSSKDLKREDDRLSNSSTSSTASNPTLAPRTARTRSVSPANGYGYSSPSQTQPQPQSPAPLIEKAGYYGLDGRMRWERDRELEIEEERERKRIEETRRRNRRPNAVVRWWRVCRVTLVGRMVREMLWSAGRVLGIVGSVFMWYLWFG